MKHHHDLTAPQADLEDQLREVVGLGRMWARHGLDLGARALQASARTLSVTSGALDALSRELRDRPADPIID